MNSLQRLIKIFESYNMTISDDEGELNVAEVLKSIQEDLELQELIIETEDRLLNKKS